MSQSKARTIQERFGFMDNDLRMPKHDEIMTWVENNAHRICEPLLHFPTLGAQHLSALNNAYLSADERANLAMAPLPPIPAGMTNKITGIKTTWEVPVKHNNFIIGFIDMRIVVSYAEVGLYIEQASNGQKRWAIGQLDNWHEFLIEVKTRIPSMGELIRQLRMYESYLFNPTFVVISPDTHFSDAIQSQGYKFVPYSAD